MGTFSRIDKTTGDKATYELYGSGDLHLGRLLHNRRFDIAMVAFLDCLKHLIEHVKSQDQTVEFPHQSVQSCHETRNTHGRIELSKTKLEKYR